MIVVLQCDAYIPPTHRTAVRKNTIFFIPPPPYPPNTHTLLPSAAGHECVFDGPFGDSGAIYYILTVGKTKPYEISSSSGVTPKMSSIAGWAGSDPAHLLFHKHDGSTINCTDDEENSWVSIDLGEGRSLIVNYYCLRHGRSDGWDRLQSWDLEGSNDGSEWTVLRVHKDDNSLPEKAFSEAAWEVEGVNQAYRHFRIRQTGANSNGHHILCCAGIELWGLLLSK
jgi:hypothetical protein